MENKLEERIAERVKAAKAQAEAELLGNDNLIDVMAELSLKASSVDKLKQLNAQCAELVESIPVYDDRKKQNTKWSPTTTYGFGSAIVELFRILNGLNFAKSQHRPSLLALTNLEEVLIEETLEAFGRTAYYSPTNGEIMQSTPPQLDKLLQLIAVLEIKLDVSIDTSKLTEENLTSYFKHAELKARLQQAEAEEALALSKLAIEV